MTSTSMSQEVRPGCPREQMCCQDNALTPPWLGCPVQKKDDWLGFQPIQEPPPEAPPISELEDIAFPETPTGDVACASGPHVPASFSKHAALTALADPASSGTVRRHSEPKEVAPRKAHSGRACADSMLAHRKTELACHAQGRGACGWRNFGGVTWSAGSRRAWASAAASLEMRPQQRPTCTPSSGAQAMPGCGMPIWCRSAAQSVTSVFAESLQRQHEDQAVEKLACCTVLSLTDDAHMHLQSAVARKPSLSCPPQPRRGETLCRRATAATAGT